MRAIKKKQFLAQDYLYYTSFVLLIIIAIAVFSFWYTADNLAKERNWLIHSQAQKISDKLIQRFNNVSNFMTYMGKTIISQDKITKSKIATILTNESAKNASVTVYDFVMENGNIIASSKDGLITEPNKVYPNQRSWLSIAPKQPWTPVISKSDIGVTSGKEIIPMGMGIMDKNNNFIGIISMGFDVKNLAIELDNSLYREGLSFAILDNELEVILQSKNQEQIIFKDFFKEHLKNTALPSNGNITPIDFNNITYSHYSKLNNYPFIILLGYDNYLSKINLQQAVTPVIIIVTLLGVFFVALLYFFRRKIMDPIIDLSKAADDISKGREVKIPRSNIAEMHSMSKQLVNVMRYMKREQKHKEKLAIAQQEAIAATNIARESKVAKETFMLQMNKELKSSISSILAISESIMRGDYGAISDKYRNAAENIFKDAYHIGQMTTSQLNKSQIDISKLLKECVSIQQDRAYQNNVDYKADIPDDLPLIYADNIRLRQIIIGIIHQSLMLTPEGESVSVTAQTTANNSKLQLIIKDTGFGGTESFRKGVVDEVGPQGIDRSVDGTDLTLDNIRDLIELHSGSLTICNNKDDKGSEFIITIPYLASDTDDTNYRKINVIDFPKKRI